MHPCDSTFKAPADANANTLPVQAAAKAAAAAEAAAVEVSSGAGNEAGTSGRSQDPPQQEGPVTRRMSHMQQDLQYGASRPDRGECI